jgi:hypothetical protein
MLKYIKMSENKDTEFIPTIDDTLVKNGFPKMGTPEFNSICFHFFGGQSKKL